jgi:hypothetical protein
LYFAASDFEFRSSNRRRGVAALGLLSLLLPCSSLAQQPGNVTVESNEQLFCTLAALNVAGYDTGAGTGTGDRTREEIRAALAKKKLPVLPELKTFYAEHRPPAGSSADLGQYVSLALLLGPPPQFHSTVPEANLPPDAKAVAGLVPLLRSFYNQADLLDLWALVQPRYDAEIARISDPVRKMITLSDAYFRFPSGAYLGRSYTITLDLLGEPEQVHARIYGQNYFLVVTPSKEPKLHEIRHQYLHFLLDPLAVKYAPEIQQRVELKTLARQAPNLAADFKEDFPLLVTECLIRAAELRMDKLSHAEAQKSVDELTASGLILAPYFYSALADYEAHEASMNEIYRPMILGIDTEAERKRLASVKFSPAPAATLGESNQPGRTLTEEDRLLDRGDNLIYGRQYAEARTAFQTVLETLNSKSERALFGLGVVAANTRKPDLAEEYFGKTLEVTRDVWVATWAHIYLGRLDDINGKREKALAEYRAASLTAGPYPEALRAVQSGLSKPFGSKD